MTKEFFITGRCFPKQHYTADFSKKLEKIAEMVERGNYFIINRPRQYGKTTTLYMLADMLQKTGEYVVLNTSFEGLGDDIFKDEATFSKGFVEILAKYTAAYLPKTEEWLLENGSKVDSLKQLSELLTQFVNQSDKEFVLMIDEVDKSSNNQLFISFLAMLRNKYLERDQFKTFHAIVLAGVHDVKNLKLKLRPDEEQKYNSPWNIAAEFKVDMNLQVAEIIPMLEEYAADKGVKMDTQHIAECLFYYTSGYPFLVSKLCKMLDEDYLPQKEEKEWTSQDVEIAVQALVKEKNTNFDSLIKNLENNEILYKAVYEVAIESDFVPFNIYNPLTELGVIHGIFVAGNGGGRIKIHNQIYTEVIVNYMSDKLRQARSEQPATVGLNYKNANGTLNMEAVILGFQQFMKKEYSKKDRDFLEKNGRLVFLAFLKPILNGSGYDFKEPQISDEKRLDVVITYLNQKYVAELKVWYGQKAHEKGLLQLVDYLNIQSLSEGYLIIFDHSEIKDWRSEWVEVQGKKIFTAWV
jgi:hypothetical protein